jgi:uncharacterized protein YdeI (YjbR/CyaY-like superfamily)
MSATGALKPRFFATGEAFREWLEKNHATRRELLVGFWKRGTGRPSLTWPESVDEALGFGWIDGVRKRIDEESYTIRFTPRQARSAWSRVNVERMAVLEREGRVAPAGRAAFARRSEERSGTYSYEQRAAAKLDADSERRFRAARAAWKWFKAQPPGYRTTATFWVVSAKREETRRRRLEQLIECSAAGRAIPPLERLGAKTRSSSSKSRKQKTAKPGPRRPR